MSFGYFPTPYPDEVLYSVIARAKGRLGFDAAQTFVSELFGTIHVRAVLDMPSHLDALVTALPTGYPLSVDDWIDDHTLLPFYVPFVQPEKLPSIRTAMRGADKYRIKPQMGALSSRAPVAEQLRYCPACVQIDRERYAEAYWHRVHQLPGVEVCPQHDCWLLTSMVAVHGNRQKHIYVSAETARVGEEPITPVDETNADNALLLAFARDALWLLGQVDLTAGPCALLDKYRTALANQRLATAQGQLHPQHLFTAFKAHYSRTLLQRWHCELGEDAETSWLIARMLRTGRHVSTPLENWLLIKFLDTDFTTFLTQPIHLNLFDDTFGDAPYPCLNPICPDYYRPVIAQWEMQGIRHDRPIARFACPTCGYTYSRLGPDTCTHDRYRVGRVIHYGKLWEKELKRLWYDEGMSFNKMAKKLRVAKLTLRQQGERLSLPFPMPGSYKIGIVPAAPNCDKVRDNHRMLWLATCTEQPDAGVSAIRAQLPNTYAYLYVQDREWLDTHHPADKRRQLRQRLDWGGIDFELSVKVASVAEALLASHDCPLRITPTLLSRTVGYHSDFLAKYQVKLPNAWTVVQQYVESTSDTAIRRIRWHGTQLRGQPLELTRLGFAAHASVTKHLHHTDVERVLNEVYQMLHDQSIAGAK